MPVPDPRAGQAFICLITFFLFLSIAAGGGCLIAYTVLPYPPTWLSYVGIAFVCLPWLFWSLTLAYRLLSRALGFRMVVGSGGGNIANGDAMPTGRSVESPPEETTPQTQAGLEGNKSKKRVSTSSNDSEMPLAISMGQ